MIENNITCRYLIKTHAAEVLIVCKKHIRKKNLIHALKNVSLLLHCSLQFIIDDKLTSYDFKIEKNEKIGLYYYKENIGKVFTDRSSIIEEKQIQKEKFQM